MSLPNILTLIRFPLTLLFIWLLLQQGFYAKLFALLVFLLASFTDFVDGYWARKHNLITSFGKIMDPIADKFLILSAFIIFAYLGLVPFWMVVIIGFREVIVTAVRLRAILNNVVLAAEKAGKIKTVIQITTITAVLVVLVMNALDINFSFCWGTIDILMILSVAVTVYSGIQFFYNNKGIVNVR